MAIAMPNISFKRDTPCRGISRSWVSSRQARCSGFMVGVPLNLTLDITKKNIIFQCMGNIQKQKVASRVVSVVPKRQALVSAVALFGIKHFSGLLSVCATPKVRVMGGSPTFDVTLPVRCHPNRARRKPGECKGCPRFNS